MGGWGRALCGCGRGKHGRTAPPMEWRAGGREREGGRPAGFFSGCLRVASSLLSAALRVLLLSTRARACCCITHREGRLVLAATRGDGRQGEDVTHNIAGGQSVAGLPARITPQQQHKQGLLGQGLPGSFEVRGEVYISQADFEAVR